MSFLSLTWYGHCAFLIELAEKKILIDPYDHFHGVDIGEIESDYLLSSSIAHDHGNIAASVEAYTIGHEGEYTLPNDIQLTGIFSHESRGTPNTIWNITHKNVSLTNFADWGDESDIPEFSSKEKEILASTTIAFVRPNDVPEKNIQCAELALKVSEPKIIIPHHYYPESFIREYPTDALIKNHAHYKPLINLLISKLDYAIEEISSYKVKLEEKDLKEKKILLFKKIHPDVTTLE